MAILGGLLVEKKQHGKDKKCKGISRNMFGGSLGTAKARGTKKIKSLSKPPIDTRSLLIKPCVLKGLKQPYVAFS